MRKITLVLFVSLLIAGCSSTEKAATNNQTNNGDKLSGRTGQLLTYQKEITVGFLRNHLKAFAADSMKGRETGTPALDKAARYLARQYKKAGLKPAGANNSYFQPFKLKADVTNSLTFVTYKNDENGSREVSRSVNSKNSSANYVRAFWGSDTLNAPVVFAGFGVVDKNRNINHLTGVDFENKWVLYFNDIPHVVNGDTVISESVDERHRIITLLRKKGATKLLVITDEQNFDEEVEEAKNQLGEKTQMRLPYLSDDNGNDSNRGFTIVSPAMGAQLLGLTGPEALDTFKQNLIKNISEFEPYATGFTLKQIPSVQTVTFETQNVVALLEGSDPQLKDQIVVLSSHYDHVGIGSPDKTGDRIYNGADDDGSGTIGLVNIAYALSEAAENGVRPRRSILFLNVAGEEKGLLGSRYYSDHPIFAIEKTVANLNVDMIGRIDEKHKKKGVSEYVYIIGGDLISSQLDSLLHTANARTGELALSDRFNRLDDPNQFYRRSDHWNFGRLGVPFIFFFSGVHEDYHQASDEAAKIRYEIMTQRVRTIFGTAIYVANTDERPVVDNQAFIKKTQE